MRRALAPEYKLLEGVLEWYFGQGIHLFYRHEPNPAAGKLPMVLINGEVFSEGRIPVNEVADYVDGSRTAQRALTIGGDLHYQPPVHLRNRHYGELREAHQSPSGETFVGFDFSKGYGPRQFFPGVTSMTSSRGLLPGPDRDR